MIIAKQTGAIAGWQKLARNHPTELFLQIRLKIISIFINIVIKEFNDALNLLDIIIEKSIAFLGIDKSNILVFNISSI